MLETEHALILSAALDDFLNVGVGNVTQMKDFISQSFEKDIPGFIFPATKTVWD